MYHQHMYPTFYSCYQIKFDQNRTCLKLRTFGEITSKPRPLMNIKEIRTKNNRDRLLIMGHLPPKYESHRPLSF